jgi:acyl-coenzyme A thioesterase PaaI-like protein
MADKSIQDTYYTEGRCFGCGPKNTKGLQIKSFTEGDQVICIWQPQPHHEAFEGILNGGIVGALFDCHANWTAAYHLMKRNQTDTPPCTVTAEFSVQLLKPTPTKNPIKLIAKVADSNERKAVIEADLLADNECCAKFRGVFVAVKPGHPAYHRW